MENEGMTEEEVIDHVKAIGLILHNYFDDRDIHDENLLNICNQISMNLLWDLSRQIESDILYTSMIEWCEDQIKESKMNRAETFLKGKLNEHTI